MATSLIIALASDNETLRDDLLQQISVLGHEGVYVPSGELITLKREYDVLLLDSELLQSASEMPFTSKVSYFSYHAVIVVTPADRLDNVGNWLGLGANDWLLYPSHPLIIKTKFEQHVRLKILKELPYVLSVFASETRPYLTSIIGSAQLLEQNILKTDDDREHVLNIIYRGGENLNRHINHSLEYLQLIYRSENILATEESDIAAALERVLSDIQKLPLLQSQTFSIHASPNLPSLKIAGIDLEHILRNLIEIAAYCAAEETEVSILALPKSENDSSLARVSIGYIGRPIDDNGKKTFFDAWSSLPFYYQRIKVAGYGLELAIAKETIELFGGKIWIESTPDGNVFHFTLPIAEPQ